MGMLLMATFAIVILFLFYAMAASSYGFVGGAICMIIVVFMPVILPFLKAWIYDGEPINKPQQTTNKNAMRNEHFAQKVEDIEANLKCGKTIKCYDKIFIFDLSEYGGTLQSSNLHCFDYKEFRKDFVYKKISFSRICKCVLYENSVATKSSGEFRKMDDEPELKNGIVLYLEKGGQFPEERLVLSFEDNTEKVFEAIDYVINNKKMWNFRTKWEDIQKIDIFESNTQLQ